MATKGTQTVLARHGLSPCLRWCRRIRSWAGFRRGRGGWVEGDAQADLDVPAGDVHVVDQQP